MEAALLGPLFVRIGSVNCTVYSTVQVLVARNGEDVVYSTCTKYKYQDKIGLYRLYSYQLLGGTYARRAILAGVAILPQTTKSLLANSTNGR